MLLLFTPSSFRQTRNLFLYKLIDPTNPHHYQRLSDPAMQPKLPLNEIYPPFFKTRIAVYIINYMIELIAYSASSVCSSLTQQEKRKRVLRQTD